MKKDADQTAAPARGHREHAQHDHGPEIQEQEDGSGPPERGRDGDGEDEDRDDQADGEAVERALDDDGGQHGPEALPSARCHVGAHHLSRAERQDIVPQIPDHERVEEMRRMGSGREEVVPAPGPYPQRTEVQADAHPEPPPVGAPEVTGDVTQVDVPEEVDEEGRTDRDAQSDLRQTSHC